MRLRKVEYDLEKKEFEMEHRSLEEESALKLEYGYYELDAKGSGSDDSAALSIRS